MRNKSIQLKRDLLALPILRLDEWCRTRGKTVAIESEQCVTEASLALKLAQDRVVRSKKAMLCAARFSRSEYSLSVGSATDESAGQYAIEVIEEREKFILRSKSLYEQTQIRAQQTEARLQRSIAAFDRAAKVLGERFCLDLRAGGFETTEEPLVRACQTEAACA